MEKIKCGIYARASTDRQGDTIENQIDLATEYIRRLGDEFDADDIEVFRDDAVSGYYTSVFDRAEMQRAIEYARDKKIQMLVFKEVSRVGRDKQENPAIIGMFEQYGVRVIAINDNYDSKNKDNITFDILSVLSEQESKKTSARVSSARKVKAARGQWNGEPPFGYVVNPETKRLEIHEELGKIPPLVFDLYVNKGMGTFKVAEYLNSRGILTKKGNLWSRETINRMLRNQAYIGQVAYGTRKNILRREYDERGAMSKKKVQIKINRKEWQIVEDAHPALIDKEIFFKAQKILLSRTHERGGGKRAYHPLTGVLVCGKCGQGMVCQKRSYKGKEYRYYICKTYHKYGRDVCSQANINATDIEPAVVEAIKKKISSLLDGPISITADRELDIKKLDYELKELKHKKDKLMKDQVDIFEQRDLFPEELYRNKMVELKNAITHIEDESSIIQSQIAGITEKIAESSSLEYLKDELKELDIEDLARQRLLVHDIVSRITVNDEELVIEYIYDFDN